MFDQIIVADWSARSVPAQGNASIWIVIHDVALNQNQFQNPPTREAAFQLIHARLLDAVDREQRALVLFDFQYSLPTGVAQVLGQGPNNLPAWRRIWAALSDAALPHNGAQANAANRWVQFAAWNQLFPGGDGPYWGRPAAQQVPGLPANHPDFGALGVVEFRITEQRLALAGGSPKSAWMVYNPGSVGSQTTLGIPYLSQLRFSPDLEAHSQVWPLETGFGVQLDALPRPFVLHAETYPAVQQNLANQLLQQNPEWVVDQAQVAAIAQWLSGLPLPELQNLFQAPQNLGPVELDTIVNEEGFILGGP